MHRRRKDEQHLEWRHIIADRARFKRRIAEVGVMMEPILRSHITSTWRVLIIDMQGFCTPEFTPKEVALTYGGEIKHLLFKSPKPFLTLSRRCQKQAVWLERMHHGLPYNSGHSNLSDIEKIFRIYDADVVYVKGSQKAEYLNNFYDNVINLEEDHDCPNFAKTRECCNLHVLNDKNAVCSLTNVQILYQYVRDILFDNKK